MAEIKAYTVAIPNLPLFPNKRVQEFVKWIGTLDGFLGMHPAYPYGTLLLFRKENQAKVARNLIQAYPEYQGTVGKNITQCWIEEPQCEKCHADIKDIGEIEKMCERCEYNNGEYNI